MNKRKKLPIALTIAGSDSGGGAGIQADLKTFASLGVHGASVITAITAQNPKAVTGIQGIHPEIVFKQIEAVFAELPPVAVKTGMLFSAPIIKQVVQFFSNDNRPALIVDPVMVSTSGAMLLQNSAVRLLRKELLPMAALVTPNLDEAEILIEGKIDSVEGVRSAARDIHDRYGCAALVKGGHLRGVDDAIDFFFDGSTELMLSSPFIKGVLTHGTGCTYSAAIAAFLALGEDLPRAVGRAKSYISSAIANSSPIARHTVLNWFSGGSL